MLSRISGIKSKTHLIARSIKMPQGYSHKFVQQKYSYPGGLSKMFLRSFSITPKYQDKTEEVLEIETDPHLYLNIHKNPYQQQVWAARLEIPEEFVSMYFTHIKKIVDAGGDRASSFNPAKFGKDTPKIVVAEYLKSVESELVNAFQKYGSQQGLTIEAFLKQEEIKDPKRNLTMPEPVEYQKEKHSAYEELQLEYEKDVFQTKLEAEVDSIMNDLLGTYKEQSIITSPLIRDTYKSRRQDPKQAEVAEYIKTDRLLKSHSTLTSDEIRDFLETKGKGLSELPKKDEAYLENQRQNKIMLSTIANIKIEQILEKRVQLKNKLKMIEDLHKMYQLEENTTSSTVKPSTFRFFNNLEKSPNRPKNVAKIYRGKNKDLLRLETLILKLQNGQRDVQITDEINTILSKLTPNTVEELTLLMKYAAVSNNDTLALDSLESVIEKARAQNESGEIHSFLPVDFSLFKDLFELFIRRDNFKALGVLINYAEERKLKITSLNLDPFKSSLEYYLNHNFKFSNLLVFMKYYVYRQECLFKEFNLTPDKLRKLAPTEIAEYGSILFPHNTLADMRDLFSYIVKRLTLRDTSKMNSNEVLSSNRIVDNHTKQDLMEKFVNYFTQYTVPFMDRSQLVNNFIRENDVADYYAGKFDEPNSLNSVMELSLNYGDRGIFTRFMQDHLENYKARNYGKLPPSYSKDAVAKYLENLKDRVSNKEISQPSEKTNELLLSIMKEHGMVEEMRGLTGPLKNHYITEAICNLKSDGSPDFYSSQVQKLFKTKQEKESDLYIACTMKALLKEGDIDSALRVLDEGEKAQVDRKKAIEKYYTNVYDHCFGSESNDIHVDFFPDILKEREERIKRDIEKASQVSEYQRKLLEEKYKKIDIKSNLPVSYTDFKEKHYGMMKTLKNNTQQMMLMKMIRAAVKDKDFKKIDQLFTYLMVNKEEETLRKGIRNKIEAYSKIYKSSSNLSTLKEANDPLRVLFDYVKKPYDDLDTLTNKYFLLVPEVKRKLESIRARKEVLHERVKHLIKEDDALFMSDHSQDMFKHLDLSELEDLGFDFENTDAKEAIQKIASQYDYLMSPITSLEKHYNFSEEQLTAARQARILSPLTPYKDILDFIRVKEGSSFVDRPEHLLAELKHIQKDDKASKEFFDKYKADKLSGGVRKRHIDSLLLKLKKSYDTSENSRIAMEESTKNIFSDRLENYFSVEDEPGKTYFINHSTGERIEVDNTKLLEDHKYFTEIVAKLAQTEIDNKLFKNFKEKSNEDKMLQAMMKSREFRKYYYFIRKFYYDKLEFLERMNLLGKDTNGNFVFYHPSINKYKDINFSKNDLNKLHKHVHKGESIINLIPGSPESFEEPKATKSSGKAKAKSDDGSVTIDIESSEKSGKGKGKDSSKESGSEKKKIHINSIENYNEFPSLETFMNISHFKEGQEEEAKKKYQEMVEIFNRKEPSIKEQLGEEFIKEFEEENEISRTKLIENYDGEDGPELVKIAMPDLDEYLPPDQISFREFAENKDIVFHRNTEPTLTSMELRNFNIFANHHFDISDFRDYFPEDEYDNLRKEFDEFAKGTTDKEKEDFVRQKLLGHKIKRDAETEISETVRELFQDNFEDYNRDVKPSKILGAFTPYSVVPMDGQFKKEKYFKRIYDEMFRDEMKREWLEFRQHKIDQYLTKNKLKAQHNIDLSIDFEALDDRTVKESIKKIAAVDHLSSLIDIVEDHKKDDIRVSKDHIAFEFFDTFSGDFVQKDSLADEFYKDLYGDDKYEEFLQQAQDDNSEEDDFGFENPYTEYPTAKNNRDLFELDHELLTSPSIPTNDFEEAYEIGMKSIEERKNKAMTPELKAAQDFEYIGDESERENHKMDPTDLIYEKDSKKYKHKFHEEFNHIEEQTKESDRRVSEKLKDPNAIMNFEKIYYTDDEYTMKEIDEDDWEEHKELSLRPKETHPARRRAYESTLVTLKHQLEDCIREQKEESLEVALEMLNRIQNIELNHTHTLNSSEIDADSIEMADPEFRQKLNEEIKKLKYSLNDSTSPSYSHIKKLHRQGLVGDSEKTLQLPNASSKVLNEVVDQLDNICEELENKERTMIQLEQAYTHTLEKSKHSMSLKRPHEKDLEKEIFEAYLEYQRNLLKELDYGTGSNFESNKSDEHKIKVIRNVFGVMEPGRMTNVGSDLIEFGISHNIPDAVRIGENLSGLNDEDVSEDLLNRLHRYKLQHADDMRETINTSGPMKSIIQRRKQSLMTARDRSGYLPSNIEELRYKYGDKYNKWRLPSIYAADHKKFGILGEIYGEERLEKFLR